MFPLFLDIEMSHAAEDAYPVALSWSLPDGKLKYVLISPDDDWSPWQNPPEEFDLQMLIDQGFTGPEVIRELQQDLSGETVFVDGLDPDEACIDLLFSTFGEEPGFELANIEELFYTHSREDLIGWRREQADQAGLEMLTAQDGVLSLLFLARFLGETD